MKVYRENYLSTEQLPITYSLRVGGDNSNSYYTEITQFTDSLLRRSEVSIRGFLAYYMNWIHSFNHESLRDEREYIFDILTCGVMWRLYGGRALRVPLAATVISSVLYGMRRRWPALKQRCDGVRARLSAAYLAGDGERDTSDSLPTPRDLRALLRWMRATGEYREETRRLNTLLRCLQFAAPHERTLYLAQIMEFSEDFERMAGKTLGRYTAGVPRFHREKSMQYSGREDAILVARREVEYHLSMVGAELMNRAFKKDFERSRSRAILLPGCMRGPYAARCKARKNDLDYTCTGCSRQCRVGQITHEYAAEGVGVHLVPHSSDFTRWLRDWAVGSDIGVIGVACVLHLITGGLELRALDIPAQCVLLDFCGCQQHWDTVGRQTDLNSLQLREYATQRG